MWNKELKKVCLVLALFKIRAGLRYPIRAISEATADPLTPKKENGEESPQNWNIKMLYDGECPLCMREVWLEEPVLAFDFGWCVSCWLLCAKILSCESRYLLMCLSSFQCQVNMLRERNKRYGTIKFVDISLEDYSPEENQGLDYKTVCS